MTATGATAGKGPLQLPSDQQQEDKNGQVTGYLEEVIRDWRGGLNTQDLPPEMVTGGASVPESIGDRVNYMRMYSMYRASFPAMLNLFTTHRGRAELRPGQHKIVSNMTDAPQGVLRYANATTTFLVVAAGGKVYAGTDQPGIVPLSLVYNGNITTGPIEFCNAYETLYWCDGTHTPQKWDGTNQRQIGIAAPISACTLADGGAGLLDDSAEEGNNPYKYWITFYNTTTGLESNPAPVSNSLHLTLRQAALSAIPISTDPQVTARRIYRQGGTLSTQRLVATIMDNTATTYTDNLPDLSVGPQLLSFVHDPPIATLTNFYFHKNRLFAWDTANPGRLWFSSFGQLEYFPSFVDDADTDGGFADVDPDPRNPFVGFAEIGSLLLIFRKENVYTWYGDTWNDFTPRRLAAVGCSSARSIAICKDQVMWLGTDAQVWSMDGSGAPTMMSKRVESLLDSVAPADLAGAAACYVDQRYILSIPRGSGVTPVVLCYDCREDSWSDLSDGQIFGATGFYVEQGNTTSGEVLFCTKAGYTWYDGTTFNGVVSALNRADTGTLLNVNLQTPAYEWEKPTWIKRATRLRIEGSCTLADPTQPLVATVTAQSEGFPDIAIDYTCSLTGPLLLDRALHPQLCGRKISVRIHGMVTAFQANTLSLRYVYVRESLY